MPMKKILCIDIEKDPHLDDIYHVVTRAINETIDTHHFNSLSHDAIMKLVTEGRLPFSEMNNDMKISQSKFYHCYYHENSKEVVIQKTSTKIAVFSD
jgi:hypothetical protein